MASQRIRTLAELLGLAAIAASLVFVGIQIKQTQDIARATMRLELSNTSREIIEVMAENPDAWLVAAGMREPADTVERVRVELLLRGVFRVMESYVYQYHHGFFDEVEWRGYREEISNVMDMPFAREFWGRVEPGYSPDFRGVVSELSD